MFILLSLLRCNNANIRNISHTTKLILEYLKTKEKVRIYHHPRQIVVSVCNRLFSNNDKIVSQVYFEDKKKNFLIDFRPGNIKILKSINYF